MTKKDIMEKLKNMKPQLNKEDIDRIKLIFIHFKASLEKDICNTDFNR